MAQKLTSENNLSNPVIKKNWHKPVLQIQSIIIATGQSTTSGSPGSGGGLP